MYAVIKTGGKQYRVSQGQKLRVEKLAGNVGDKSPSTRCCWSAPRASHQDRPAHVAGAKVEATITAQDRAKKIIVFKFRRRKNYRRKQGHRQPYTELHIDAISG
jgi:large subunit ribosomal protein L21